MTSVHHWMDMDSSVGVSDGFLARVSHRDKPSDPQREVENENNSSTLVQSKDRAQLTATSAMSVIHVALLKEVLDQGPEKMQYYTTSLVLICTALALQIIAGLIAIVVSQMRNYYSTHKDDLCEDCFANLCCCRVVCKRTREDEDTETAVIVNPSTSSHAAEEKSGQQTIHPVSFPFHGPSFTASRVAECCPCRISCSIYSDHEYKILDSYEQWVTANVPVYLNAARAEAEVQILSEQIASAKKGTEALEGQKDVLSKEDFHARHQELDTKLQAARKKKESMERAVYDWKVARGDGTNLWELSDDIRKNHVLKLATFWQNILTYVFYVVFVLNVFITGMGFAGSKP